MSDFKTWREEQFPGQKFAKQTYKDASKLFKKNPETARKFLTEHLGEPTYDFQAPAKCLIVAQSRPFNEWPIVQAAEAVQRFVFALPKTEAEKKPENKIRAILNWATNNKIDLHNFSSSQGLNGIVNRAFSIYAGTVKKVENRNEKRRVRLERINQLRAERGEEPLVDVLESAFNPEGYLQQPPGLNPNIYCYQAISPRAVDPKKDKIILAEAGYSNYSHPKTIPRGKGFFDRLSIPVGSPGHVPHWIRPQLNQEKKRLRHYSSGGELLAIIKIDSDWILIDLRGLLRAIRWRNLGSFNLTVAELLEMFTGDPVIDVKRRQVVFMSKPGLIETFSKKTVSYKHRKTLLEAVGTSETGLVSIDLGKNNPIAVKISKIKAAGEQFSSTLVERLTLDDLGISFIPLYQAYDQLEADIKNQAIQSLSPEEQKQVRDFEACCAEVTKNNLLQLYNLCVEDVLWSEITHTTTHIAQAALAKNPEAQVWTDRKLADGTTEKVKMTDGRLAKLDLTRYKLTPELREKLNKTIWDLKRNSERYWQLSRRKAEICRHIRNLVVQRAEKHCGNKVILNLEDLNLVLFHGSGRRAQGWEALFQPKKESRWLMQALHKAFTELAPNRGITVVLSNPQRTSMTCTQCGHCDPGNRSGEEFACLSCKFKANADLEIATDNLEKVLLIGQAMPRREQPSDDQKAVPSRNRVKSSKSQAKLVS